MVAPPAPGGGNTNQSSGATNSGAAPKNNNNKNNSGGSTQVNALYSDGYADDDQWVFNLMLDDGELVAGLLDDDEIMIDCGSEAH
eukprot:8757577-Alexandrium_andersonii.AAC.1